MAWRQQIKLFQPLTFADVMLFAPTGEMEQALNTYNRAVFNLHRGGEDIALIALRKLAAAYPMFPHPAALLGLCLAQADRPEEALDQFDRAMLAALPDDLQEAALFCRDTLLAAAAEPEVSEPSPGSLFRQRALTGLLRPTGAGGAGGHESGGESLSGSHSRISVQSTGFLERAGRSKRLEMASERERQEILRAGDQSERFGMGRSPLLAAGAGRDPLTGSRRKRIAVIIALLLAAGLLVWAAYLWLPGFPGGRRTPPAGSDLPAVTDPNTPSADAAQDRLNWWLERLKKLAEQNPAVSDLLQEYRNVYPD